MRLVPGSAFLKENLQYRHSDDNIHCFRAAQS